MADEATGKKREGRALVNAFMLVAALWCVAVVYVIVCVSYLGVTYPLGRSAVAGLVYGTLLMNPMYPNRTKLDLPILLIHAFLLFKCSQWLWRQRRLKSLSRFR